MNLRPTYFNSACSLLVVLLLSQLFTGCISLPEWKDYDYTEPDNPVNNELVYLWGNPIFSREDEYKSRYNKENYPIVNKSVYEKSVNYVRQHKTPLAINLNNRNVKDLPPYVKHSTISGKVKNPSSREIFIFQAENSEIKQNVILSSKNEFAFFVNDKTLYNLSIDDKDFKNKKAGDFIEL